MYVFNTPPGWPPPPGGWLPPPNWRPDPSWPPMPAGWQLVVDVPPLQPLILTPFPPVPASYSALSPFPSLPRAVEPDENPYASPFTGGWRLDRVVALASSHAGGTWRARVAIVPLLALVAAIVVGGVAVASIDPHGNGVAVASLLLTLLGYGVAVAAAVAVGRPVARAAGGWAAAFGWSRPIPRDAPAAVGVTVVGYLVRILVSAIVVLLIPTLQNSAQSNVDLSGSTGATIAVVGVSSILIAPPVEELLFRGLLLRTLMRRMRFWPAALISSVLFAALHAYEVSTWRAAVLLVLSLAVFAIGQCLLVRWTARLAPAIGVHMLSNAFAFVLSVTVLS